MFRFRAGVHKMTKSTLFSLQLVASFLLTTITLNVSNALPSRPTLLASAAVSPFPVIDQHGLLVNSSADFTLNDTIFRVLSGSIDYFRVPHQYWQDRLERLRALGLNTVETSVPWNLHESFAGNVDFNKDLDLRTFLKTAQSLGLFVVLRAGPFIGAELDFGGLPSWLLRDANMTVRSLYPPFMQAVDSWFDKLFKEIGDLQYMYGGPIIAIQVEEQYGSFGNISEYVIAVGNSLIRNNATELLFTADGDSGRNGGFISGVLATHAGQTGMNASLTALRGLQPNAPLMVSEFRIGAVDSWGDNVHHTWPVDQYLVELQTILDFNASVNFYMAHGGTSFAFTAGANLSPNTTDSNAPWIYHNDVTTFDCDALVGEDGTLHPTKYNATRNLLARTFNLTLPSLPTQPVRHAYGTFSPNAYLPLYPEITMNHYVPYASNMLHYVQEWQVLSDILPMEMLDVNNGGGQQLGYTVYRRDLTDIDFRAAGDDKNITTILISGGIRDRVLVTYGGIRQGPPVPTDITAWIDAPMNMTITWPQFSKFLNIFVENRGRAQFAAKEWSRDVLNIQRKGLQAPVLFSNNTVQGLNLGRWFIYPFDFKPDYMQMLTDDPEKLFMPMDPGFSAQQFPGMLRYTLNITDAEDTFLYVAPAIVKGVVFVNGRNLGRFWQIGPQRSLYVPKWYWNATSSNNSIMIFAEEAYPTGAPATDYNIQLLDTPNLGREIFFDVNFD